ncbi:MAG: AbrB/MazE/SpoVT family DNA-binding domain-containing protein [Candidatus Brockarchaeota archaeon]|nr:AbrB/MazE/SpoVT family DNA-binding domain-containing protein [Candidatus Brockarchaeota archaeon]
MNQTKVTRKYQITIPKEVRESLKIGIGDVLRVKVEGCRIILEPTKPIIKDPVEYLSNLSKRHTNIDAVKLVEESWSDD